MESIFFNYYILSMIFLFKGPNDFFFIKWMLFKSKKFDLIFTAFWHNNKKTIRLQQKNIQYYYYYYCCFYYFGLYLTFTVLNAMPFLTQNAFK